MDLQVNLITFFAIIFVASSSGEELSTVDYVVSIIKHVASTEKGVMSCLFYAMQYDEGVLEEVLSSPELGIVSKILLTNATLPEHLLQLHDTERDHLMIVIECNNVYAKYRVLAQVLELFDPKIKVLALADVASYDFQACAQMLDYRAYCNVVFLDEEHRLMLASDVVKRVPLDYRAHPETLFDGSWVRNMSKRSLRYSSREPLVSHHPLLRWLRITALFMNTQLQESKHNCSQNLVHKKYEDKCYLEHVLHQTDVDLSTYNINKIGQIHRFRLLFAGVPDEDVIVVPRTQITLEQLFTLPFESGVWILLTLILGTIQALKLAFPSALKNDPLMLIVCGYERHDLAKAGILEKFLLLSTIVLMFFASCAYETKLLSMMISKPASQKIGTIEELLHSGLKVKVDLNKRVKFTLQNGLNDILIHCNDTSKLDHIHAYIMERIAAELYLPQYYDPEKRFHRYIIMDQTLGFQTKGIMLGYRNPFLTILGTTYQALVESGIFTFWVQKIILTNKNFIRRQSGIDQRDFRLLFSDIFPAWTVLGIGIAASLLVFALEISINFSLRKYR